MHDPGITVWDEANGGTASRSNRYEDKMLLVRRATSAHSLLRFAPKNAMAKTNTGMAINNPRTGIMVKLISVKAKPRKSKNRPTAKSENLSK
jgi:hypothetical protein